jgi:MoxR-like ATPase
MTTPTTTNLPVPECWQDFDDALRAGIDRIILFGPSGSGKSYGGLTMGDITAGSYRLTCNEDMTSADVTGHFMMNGTAWEWNEGAVLRAWKGNGHRGGRLVADEINTASGDVLSLLLAMFDSPESASWTHPATKQTFTPAEGFSVVMTTNVEDMRELPTALRDRFPVAIRINRPHPNALLRLSADLREAAASSIDADGDRRYSLRAFLAFDKLRPQLGTERAATMVFGRNSTAILDAIRINEVA